MLLVGMILDGLTFIPIFWVQSISGLAVVIVIHTSVIPLLIVTRPAIIQSIVPTDMQGRVFALVNVTIVGFTALSTGLVGIVAEAVPIRMVFAVIGIGTAACGVLGWASKLLRNT
ncbi:MAG: hypothetical protein QGH20_11170 [Candidatus Latescibacteria bacterium]|nr:hypothetical protein [Candidatus Latescibacterota bacterium]